MPEYKGYKYGSAEDELVRYRALEDLCKELVELCDHGNPMTVFRQIGEVVNKMKKHLK